MYACRTLLPDVTFETRPLRYTQPNTLIDIICEEEGLGTDGVARDNLFRALRHLIQFDGGGYLDMEFCIKDTHAIVMSGLPMMESGPGQFSPHERFTYMGGGETHNYPHKLDWDPTMLTLVDRYNNFVADNNNNISRLDFTEIAKILGWFAYTMISYHPFGDGNGRLCRLIIGYLSSRLIHEHFFCSLGPKDYLIEALVKDRTINNDSSIETTKLLYQTNTIPKK